MTIYIVSGLERSGTSLMMQILEKGGFPVDYDYVNGRKVDENNPRGYYELFNGKIIDRIRSGDVHFEFFEDRGVKITAYGLQFLPNDREYKVIFMMRNYKEILKSQNKMMNNPNYMPEDIKLLNHINVQALKHIENNDNFKILKVSHRMLMNAPEVIIKEISEFLGKDISKGISAIDKSLWRNRDEG